MLDTIVIGSGIAGITSAIRLAQEGQKVAMITFGHGGLQLSQGSVDVLGYDPQFVDAPLQAVQAWAQAHPEHPYAKISPADLRAGLDFFASCLGKELLIGDPEKNEAFPTAAGAMRPTALYPPSWEAGKVVDGKHYLIVGVDQYKDLYPELVAGNLARTTGPHGEKVTAQPVRVSFPARAAEADSSAMNYGRALDNETTLRKFVDILRKAINGLPDGVVGLPGFLGITDPQVFAKIGQAIGREVFEIPCLPPSPGGLRFYNKLLQMAKDLRVRVVMGSAVVGFAHEGKRITTIRTEVAGHHQDWAARNFLHAPGGFESGGLEIDSYLKIREKVFDLPLQGADLDEPTHADYWGDPQPLFRAGVGVDTQMRPVANAGNEPQVVWENLRCAGGILAGATRWDELSGDGIALGSAWAATSSLLQEAK